MITVSYFIRVQPLTGQFLEEGYGLELPDVRPWADSDRAQFPQAERQLWPGSCLVVDRTDGAVYAVTEVQR